MTGPEDWTGQRVKVRIDVSGGIEMPCVLDGVSEKGIVVRYRIEGEG